MKTPIGIKILSILGYISGFIELIFGLLLFSGIKNVLNNTVSFTSLISGFITLFGVILLIFGLISIILATGLWKGKNWARIVTLIFTILSIIGILSSILQGKFSNLISLTIEILIVYYLLFNKDVKTFFKSKKI